MWKIHQCVLAGLAPGAIASLVLGTILAVGAATASASEEVDSESAGAPSTEESTGVPSPEEDAGVPSTEESTDVPSPEESADVPSAEDADAAEQKRHPILFYIPNRVFDVLDVVRLRVRVGPGMAVGARVTQAGEVLAGAYSSIFVGLRGPRGKPRIPWPLGVERYAGVEVSVAGPTADVEHGPDYGPLEVGLGGQAVILGGDVGIAPLEVLDLVTGFLLVDLRHDDF
jgi:hypothetical protein